MKHSFVEHHLFQLLRRFDNQHLPLDLFLSRYFRAYKALGAQDRRTIATAVYGMCRWQGLIDYLIENEPSWQQRYALFRGFRPEQYLYVNTIPLHIRVSFPQELFSLLVKDYGEEKAIYLSQICNTEAPTTIRINPLKTTREEMVGKLSEFEAFPTEKATYGVQLKRRAPLVAMPEFKEGYFEIQDEASQCVAEIVQAAPGDHMLDFCAGAGGKTLAIAPLLEGKGQLYLHDIRSFILEQAKKRFKRAGIQNVQFLQAGHSHLSTLVGKMDWVLVDAPCSGTGTLRRNPDQKWKFTPAMLNRLIGEQRVIFEQALAYLRPGGKIVYATCSLLKAENELQAEHFLHHHNLEWIGEPFSSLPTYDGMDGFFAATFRQR